MIIEETRQAIESILMVADQPVEPSVLAQLLEVPKTTIEEACAGLAAEYAEQGRGFVLVQVAGGYRFQSHPDLAPYVERFVLDGQTSRLSAAALETLAIVAYKQPISRMQIAAIRGVNVDGVLRTLQQRGYVDEVSRDPGPGNAVLFGTTSLFLERVGLNSLGDLPPLGEFVPGADVVEALEEGLRPEPLPDLVPADAASVDGSGAAEDAEADPEEAELPATAGHERAAADEVDPERGSDDEAAPDRESVDAVGALDDEDQHETGSDHEVDDGAVAQPGSGDGHGALREPRLGDHVVAHDGGAPDLVVDPDADPAVEPEIDLTTVDLSESVAPTAEGSEVVAGDTTGSGDAEITPAATDGAGDRPGPAVELDPDQEPSSPAVAPLTGPVATIRHDEAAAATAAPAGATERTDGSVTFRSAPDDGGSRVEAPAGVELAEGEVPTAPVTSPSSVEPGRP